MTAVPHNHFTRDVKPVGQCPACDLAHAMWAANLSSDLWHAMPNDKELLEFLTRATCPAPCVGYVNDTGWHKGCEKRAQMALDILRGW